MTFGTSILLTSTLSSNTLCPLCFGRNLPTAYTANQHWETYHLNVENGHVVSVGELKSVSFFENNRYSATPSPIETDILRRTYGRFRVDKLIHHSTTPSLLVVVNSEEHPRCWSWPQSQLHEAWLRASSKPYLLLIPGCGAKS